MKATHGVTGFPRPMGRYDHPPLPWHFGKSVGDCSLNKELVEGLQRLSTITESGSVLTACVNEYSGLLDAGAGGDAFGPPATELDRVTHLFPGTLDILDF